MSEKPDSPTEFKIAYAEAIEAFEHVMFQIRFEIEQVFMRGGLEDGTLTAAMLVGLSAGPLAEAWKSLFVRLSKEDSEHLTNLRAIGSALTSIRDNRNTIAHAAFWSYSDEDVETVGRHTLTPRHTKMGAKWVTTNIRITDLRSQRIRCESVRTAIVAFTASIRHKATWQENANRRIKQLQWSDPLFVRT